MTTSTVLSATAPIRVLREAIYEALDICAYVHGNKAIAVRKRCGYARGLDLRRKADTVLLAQHLGLVAQPAVPVLDDHLPKTSSTLKQQHPDSLGYWSLELNDWAFDATKTDHFDLARALIKDTQTVNFTMALQPSFAFAFR